MIEAHYTTETKVKPPKLIAEAPSVIPKHYLFSDKEAEQKIQSINTDIYEGAKKEKKKNEFDKLLYLKIVGGVALFAAVVAGIRGIGKFFRKS